MRKVVATTPSGKNVLFESAKVAAIAIGLSSQSPLSNCLRGKCSTSCGWTWEYHNPKKEYAFVGFDEVKDTLYYTRQDRKEWEKRKSEAFETLVRMEVEKERRQTYKALHIMEEKALDELEKRRRAAEKARAKMRAILEAGVDYSDPIATYARTLPTLTEGMMDNAERRSADREREIRRSILSRPHTWGFYEKTSGCIKLPVSGTIIANTSKGRARLRAELKGREWCYFDGRKIAVVNQ